MPLKKVVVQWIGCGGTGGGAVDGCWGRGGGAVDGFGGTGRGAVAGCGGTAEGKGVKCQLVRGEKQQPHAGGQMQSHRQSVKSHLREFRRCLQCRSHNLLPAAPLSLVQAIEAFAASSRNVASRSASILCFFLAIPSIHLLEASLSSAAFCSLSHLRTCFRPFKLKAFPDHLFSPFMANAMGQELQVVWPVFGIRLANSQATCLEHAVGVMPLVRMQANISFSC